MKYISFSLLWLVTLFYGQSFAQPLLPQAVDKLPPLSGDIISAAFDQINQSDFLFNNLPFTTSSDNENAKAAIQFFTLNPVDDQACAKPFGSAIFTGSKGIILDCQFFYAKGCTWWKIKYQDKWYANQMSDKGIKYFQQILANYEEKKNNPPKPGTGH